MFSRNNKGAANTAAQTPPTPVKPSAPSIISADLRIVGDLQSQGEIQVDGAVDGDIRTHTLLVGEGAHITGEIVADNIVVHGNISGQVKARSVQLAKTAHVIGDILHENLAIETGAFLEGHCKRMVQKKDVLETPPAKPKTVDAPASNKVANA